MTPSGLAHAPSDPTPDLSVIACVSNARRSMRPLGFGQPWRSTFTGTDHPRRTPASGTPRCPLLIQLGQESTSWQRNGASVGGASTLAVQLPETKESGQ